MTGAPSSQHWVGEDGLPLPWSASQSRLQQELSGGTTVGALWHLRDAVECAVRLLVGTAAAERVYRLGFQEAGRALAPILAPRPSLGNWVSVLQALAGAAPVGVVGEALSQLARRDESRSAWARLFEGGAGVVAFRNRTLGHGAFGGNADVTVEVQAFALALRDLSQACADRLWRQGRLELATVGPESPWRQLRFAGPDGAIPLDPVIRARHSAGRFDLLLLNYFHAPPSNPERARAAFLDYAHGDHAVDTQFFPVVAGWWPTLAPLLAAPRQRVERLEEEVDEQARFDRRLVPVRYLERALAGIANTCAEAGAWVVLTGVAGSGKSWAARSLQRLSLDAESPEWAWESLLHGEGCLRLRAALGAGLDAVWDALSRQLHALGLPPPRRDQAMDLGAWITATRDASATISPPFVLVVLDGLDELPDTTSTETRLQRLLGVLPARSLVLLTSRPNPVPAVQRVLDRLADRQGPSCHALHIEPTSEANLSLQRAHLRSRLRGRPDLWDAILAKSGGVFLFTSAYAHAVQRGFFPAGEALPSRDDFYPAYVAALRDRLGGDVFDSAYLRVLLVLAAAREPLSTEAMHEEWGLPPEDTLRSVLRDLADLVDTRRTEEGNRHELAHLTLRQFLGVAFRSEGREVEGRFATLALQRQRQRAAMAPEEVVRDPAAAYALQHLPHHSRHDPAARAAALGDARAAALALTLAAAEELPAASRLAYARRAADGFEYLAARGSVPETSAFAAVLKVAACLLDVGAATDCTRELLALQPRVPPAVVPRIATMLARAAFLDGNLQREGEALSLDEDAIQRAPPEDQAAYLMASAALEQRTGRAADSITTALRAADTAPGGTAGLTALSWAATAAFYVSRNWEALRVLDRAEREYVTMLAGEEPRRAELLQTRGLVLHNLDQNRGVLECQRACRDYYQRAGDAQNYLLSLVNVGDAYWGLGDSARAIATLHVALDGARTAGLPQAVDVAAICLANALADNGEEQRALRLLDEGLAIARGIGHDWDVLYGELCRARLTGRIAADPEVFAGIARRAALVGYGYPAAVAQAYAAAQCFRHHLRSPARDHAHAAIAAAAQHEVPGAAAIGWAIIATLEPSEASLSAFANSLQPLEGLKGELELVDSLATAGLSATHPAAVAGFSARRDTGGAHE